VTHLPSSISGARRAVVETLFRADCAIEIANHSGRLAFTADAVDLLVPAPTWPAVFADVHSPTSSVGTAEAARVGHLPAAAGRVIFFGHNAVFALNPSVGAAPSAAPRYRKTPRADAEYTGPHDPRATLWSRGIAHLPGDGSPVTLDDMIAAETRAYASQLPRVLEALIRLGWVERIDP
jgi:hypothetical protein